MAQPTPPPIRPERPSDWPATTNYGEAMALIASLPEQPDSYADRQVAIAHVHATLAVADMIGSLDTAVRRLHEALTRTDAP